MMDQAKKRNQTCCFTGHRNIPAEQESEIIQRTMRTIRTLILEKGVRFFGVGGAVGYDTLAAESLFWIKEHEFPHIRVILVYPFQGFTERWTERQKARYNKLLCKYDKVVCVGDFHSKEAYKKRNRYLVDHSAYCISYCTRNFGGTAYTVRYAREQRVTVIELTEGANPLPAKRLP